MAKKEFHIWVTPEVGEEIQRRAREQARPVSQVVEQVMRQSMQADAAAQIDRDHVPAIRAAVKEDQALALEELRKHIRADVKAITQQNTDRLAGMEVRVARATSLAWRLMYRLIQRQYGAITAQSWYDEEYAKAGKAMATKVTSGKEIEQ